MPTTPEGKAEIPKRTARADTTERAGTVALAPVRDRRKTVWVARALRVTDEKGVRIETQILKSLPPTDVHLVLESRSYRGLMI
jgi:uncharacterized GH25 family protein